MGCSIVGLAAKRGPLATMLLLLLLAFGTRVEAAVVINPGAITANSLGNAGSPFYAEGRAIDQSGLSSTYVSGVTDLSTYLGLSPTATTTFGENWATASGNIVGNIDFDLGQAYDLSTFLLWNHDSTRAVKDFDLVASAFPDFSAATTASFSATQPLSSPVNLQTFNFSATDARYVRLQINSNHGFDLDAIAEMAFGGNATVVPEPTTVLIWSLLAGLGVSLGWRRRR